VFITHLCGDGKALAVFSFQEGAQMFLNLRTLAQLYRANGSWRPQFDWSVGGRGE
jgi:hypothetical protein